MCSYVCVYVRVCVCMNVYTWGVWWVVTKLVILFNRTMWFADDQRLVQKSHLVYFTFLDRISAQIIFQKLDGQPSLHIRGLTALSRQAIIAVL